MRKIILSVALATATLAAVPAAAQYQGAERHWNDRRGGVDHRGPNRQAVNQLRRQLNQVDSRIDVEARRGSISRREAVSLNRQAQQLRNQIARSSRNGISNREFVQLRQQVNRLEQRLRSEMRDRDRRRR